MQRIIVDTNVFVSALIQRSYPYYILTEIISNNNIQLCISEALFQEYYHVLNREKFSKYPDFISRANLLLVDIKNIAVEYAPSIKLDIIKDKDDNKLLELAEASKAHFLITGNSNDFTFEIYNQTKIVSPKQYWEQRMNR